jgi:hypothetical protein
VNKQEGQDSDKKMTSSMTLLLFVSSAYAIFQVSTALPGKPNVNLCPWDCVLLNVITAAQMVQKDYLVLQAIP